ncbi:tRNA(His) guanylyltransferase 1 isoform X2 [Ricinus communis]|uniref:tRNA(His) guanylyltransferase 1 isoform X2 n=1 Tax=Ricinus communis TaxID=3988 RepID=UPI00077263AD|nr:tRNA(His) guanylyltransferase 1 isoform X2 [Ricinus communis]|eukprot:XP_015581517.1 tRNA(His) guanylyltransferase 1 isoform X2 [Ricinus communis]
MRRTYTQKTKQNQNKTKRAMANSKYEYVKSYEVEDEVMLPNIIVVRIDGHDFRRFSKVHEFELPNDENCLKLMNECATCVLREYPDIVFSYGSSDEYSFVFKKKTKFYQRRASKILSLVVSFFSSIYVTKWKKHFPQREMRYPPSFHGQVIPCASIEVLQEYLAWRQRDCHVSNLYNTCLWKLVESGKTEREAQEILKGTQKQEKHDLLYLQFGVNYNNCNEEDIVKYRENGTPVRRLRRKAITVHSENIAGRCFWNGHQNLLIELGGFAEDIGKVNPDYIRSFLFKSKLLQSTWVVIRIDGCHFHRFSDGHEFEKPNDEQALNLMNSCAVAVLKEFQDVVFAYGVSDEYSFVLKKDSKFYSRQASDIVSVIVSFFSSMYVMNWKSFFPQKDLKYPPSFDGRAICYPSSEILQDYLAWRQVDCHINNQYNTCFWALVKSGKSKTDAQSTLKGTQVREKNEILAQFGIDYNNLPLIFRQGSSVFRVKEDIVIHENGASAKNLRTKVIVQFCDIIVESFWKEHPDILG